MSNVNVTPNMNLPNPVPGVDPGIDYANNLQSSLNIVDQHNHSAGQGVLIQPNGLNISSDLPFNGNNATILKTVRFQSQASPITNSAPNIGCLYVSGNELWYNDYTGGNQVQITSNGLINATSSGISSGTASAVFSAGTLLVKSSSTSFADIAIQSALFANSGNLINQLTLQAPTLSSSYVITLPTIPAQTNVMTLDSSGNMGSITYDAVGQAMSSVGADAIANTRTRTTGSTVGVGGVAISSSSGTFSTSSGSYVSITSLSVSITTSGRPVMVLIQPSGIGYMEIIGTTGEQISFTLSGTTSTAPQWVVNCISGSSLFLAPTLSFVDVPSPGTQTYTAQLKVVSASQAIIQNMVLVAYEL